MRRLVAVVAVLSMILLLSACEVEYRSGPADTSDPASDAVPTLPDMEDMRGEEKAYAIAEYITEKSDGLLMVVYAEIPPHYRQDGSTFFGVHYNAFIVQRADQLTGAEKNQILDYVGEIFMLTKKHVISGEHEDLDHMGVQLVDPDIWWYGGHERGESRIYIAPRENLRQLDYEDSPRAWLAAAVENPQTLVMTGTLQNLINQLRAAQQEESRDPAE